MSRVLRTLGSVEPNGAGTSAIARAVDVPRPTVHRLLSALQAEGFVDRDRTSGRWLLGPELYLLGSSAQSRYDVTSLARPHVRRLAQLTGENAFFSLRRGDETVCLIQEEGSFPLRSHVLHEGARFPLGVVSAGIVVLAYLDKREVDAYLSRTDLVSQYGDKHSAASIRERLAQARRDGWALNPGLIVEGSWGMAAAVFNAENRVVGALSLTGVERRFGEERRPVLGTSLLQEAHQLSVRVRSGEGTTRTAMHGRLLQGT